VLLLETRVKKYGGALVKTVGEGILAAFPDSASAVKVGLDLGETLASGEATKALRARAVVHRGPAMAATINDQLDYFGLTVAQTAALLRAAGEGDLMLSSAVAAEPAVMAVLRARGREVEVAKADLPGIPSGVVHRIRPNGRG
jgi:class 3 adenylate cyclase